MNPLPPLKCGAMEIVPTIVVDSREQTPLTFTRLPSVRAGLLTADYSIKGLESVFGIERKSIADLVSCCAGSNRERFENELHRLRGFRFRRLLIVGTREEIERHEYRSQIAPAAVLGTLSAFEVRYDCPVVYAPDPAAAAAQVEMWAWHAVREHLRAVGSLTKGAKDA